MFAIAFLASRLNRSRSTRCADRSGAAGACGKFVTRSPWPAPVRASCACTPGLPSGRIPITFRRIACAFMPQMATDAKNGNAVAQNGINHLAAIAQKEIDA